MKPRVLRHEVTQPPDQSYRIIPLTKGQNALVDAEDYEWLLRFNWHARLRSGNFYAIGPLKDGKRMGMHREVMRCSPNEEADHINFNTLDNRKSNLRKCTHRQNCWHRRKGRKRSRSGFKGVHLDKGCGRWVAQIMHTHIGMFATAEEAAHAYDDSAKRIHGEFAHLNFPHGISNSNTSKKL